MKKVLSLIVLCCLVISSVVFMTGCTMSETPDELAGRFENVADGYTVSADKGGAGDSVTFELAAEKTFNAIVLKEKGDNITGYELYVDGEMFYKSDFIGKYKYCSFKTLTAKTITLKVIGCKKNWKITAFEAYDIGKTAKDDFAVMSYLIADRACTLTEESAAHMSQSTQFNLFGAVYFDKNGHLRFPDFQIEGETLDGKTVLARAAAKVREYNPTATIVYTVLGNMEFDGDGLDVEKRHNGAMRDNPDTLIKECIELMQEMNFDGISFDYESPHSPRNHKNYGNFLEKLKKAMPEGKLLTAALGIWHLTVANCFPLDKLQYLDSVELMAYDNFDKQGNHAAFYETCASAIYKLQRKGIDLSKIHLGLPFYSRPDDEAEYWGDYYTAAEELGVWGNSRVEEITTLEGKTYNALCYYNGRQMVYDKTCYASDLGLGGVMIWHYTCDTNDEGLSLYGAIGEAIASRK